jgi:hypothetical protein
MKHYVSRRSMLNTVMPVAVALIGFVLPSRASAQERQPNMQAALEALRQARRELDQATPDKGGHRAKAIALVNQAIAEVEKGVQFDRRN